MPVNACPDKCRCKSVWVTCEDLGYIPLGIPVDVDYLSIENSNITHLDFPEPLPLLTRLHVFKTNISSFNSSNYTFLDNLVYLTFDESDLQQISLVGELKALTDLVLAHTKLEVMNTTLFRIPNIKSITIRSSPLKIIDFSKGLESLDHLFMKELLLESLDSSTVNLPGITRLEIESLPLNGINLSDAVPTLQHLISLIKYPRL